MEDLLNKLNRDLENPNMVYQIDFEGSNVVFLLGKPRFTVGAPWAPDLAVQRVRFAFLAGAPRESSCAFTEGPYMYIYIHGTHG